MKASGIVHLADAEARIPGPSGEHAVSFFQRGTVNALLALGRFTPHRPAGEMTRHTQDEIYVIVRGRGVFAHAGARDYFDAGDLLFVAAGVEHAFEDFSDDLAVWAIFYGP